MGLYTLAGIVLISGAGLFVFAGFIAPRGLYQEPSIDWRVAMVEAHQTRWIVSQILFALGMLVPALGYLLISRAKRQTSPAWIPFAAAALILIGAVAGTIFVIRQTGTPRQFWEAIGVVPSIAVYVAATMLALVLYGFLFVRGAFPDWLGYVNIGYAVVAAVAVIGFKLPAFFSAGLAHVLTIITGIVALQVG